MNYFSRRHLIDGLQISEKRTNDITFLIRMSQLSWMFHAFGVWSTQFVESTFW